MTRGKQWQVKCQIQKGMFEDEYLVAIDVVSENGEQGQATSFADRNDLRTDAFPVSDESVNGWLNVSPMQVGKDRARVVLPKPTMANGSIIFVPTSNLTAK